MKKRRFTNLFYCIIIFAVIISVLCVYEGITIKNLSGQIQTQKNQYNALYTNYKKLQNDYSTIKKEASSTSNTDVTANSGKIAYLTFDDGPSKITPQILDILKQNNVHATFFVIGLNCQRYPDDIKQIDTDGDVVGVHSWTHKYSYIYANMQNFQADFTKLRDYIKQITGIEPNICRFPGGTNNTISNRYCPNIMQQIAPYVKSIGFTAFDWNDDAKAATTPEPSSTGIYNNVIDGLKKKDGSSISNAVVLFHDADKDASTLQALPNIISTMRKMGYTFATLSPKSKEIMFNPS